MRYLGDYAKELYDARRGNVFPFLYRDKYSVTYSLVTDYTSEITGETIHAIVMVDYRFPHVISELFDTSAKAMLVWEVLQIGVNAVQELIPLYDNVVAIVNGVPMTAREFVGMDLDKSLPRD